MNNGNLKQQFVNQHRRLEIVSSDPSETGVSGQNNQVVEWSRSGLKIVPDRGQIGVTNFLNHPRTQKSVQPTTNVYYFPPILPAGEKADSIYTAQIGNFQLVDVAWRSTLTLEQAATDSHYIIYFPLVGFLEQRIDGQPAVECSSTTASIINPGQKLVAISSKQGQALLIIIDCQSIESVLGNILNRSLKQPLSFESEIDLTSDFGVSLKEFVQFLRPPRDIHRTVSSPLVQEELERALLGCLLKGFNHNYTDEILYHTQGALAYYVKQAQVFIESHLHEDITLGDIATAVGVCGRLLQKAFSQHCDCSPMRFVTRTRLQRIRQDLEQTTTPTKITDVMLRYGLMQGGKFAREYYKLFGEKPSDTLKRSKYHRDRQSSHWQEIDDFQAQLSQGGCNYFVRCKPLAHLTSLVSCLPRSFINT
jgi:AraC-like DNA-binding protein